MAPPKAVTATSIDTSDPQTYEDQHVHSVYDQIAPHFSSTRYKPWPIIAQFLSSIPTGWIGLDSGTGNGKYLPLPLDRPGSIWTIGLDRSRNLLSIAQNAGGVAREVIWGDVLDNPWRHGVFDYAISIATIHHLATPVRRKAAVKSLLKSIDPSHGRALIYVWAIEQDTLSKRAVPTGEDDNGTDGQDVFVPWVLASQTSKTNSKQEHTEETDKPKESQVFNRYYHMFARGELRSLVENAARDIGLHIGKEVSGARGVEIIQDGWERSNYYVEIRRWSTE
ncbi:S-adenosyl-L-methionine-dependent methyltransferase [Abortiporus biennis]|nr:S-adenosyl-L-methionine-dependent methyltransferase [Abortiporus biennis]